MAGMNDWSQIEFGLYDSMAGHNPGMYNDQWMQTLYDAALFDHDVASQDRSAILNALRDHMWNEYGMDFDDVFNWDGFREAYDNAQV